MRKIKPEVWSKAFNDPTWIRDVFKLMFTFESFDWPTGLIIIRSEHQFEKSYKIRHSTPSSRATILRNIIIANQYF